MGRKELNGVLGVIGDKGEEEEKEEAEAGKKGLGIDEFVCVGTMSESPIHKVTA